MKIRSETSKGLIPLSKTPCQTIHQAKWKRFHVNMHSLKIFTRSESKLISFLRYSKCRKALYKIDENFKREEVLDIFLGDR